MKKVISAEDRNAGRAFMRELAWRVALWIAVSALAISMIGWIVTAVQQVLS